MIGVDGIQHIQQIGHVEADCHAFFVVSGINFLNRLFLLWIMCLNFNIIF